MWFVTLQDKAMTGFGFAGVMASLILSACCLGSVALALLGFLSTSAVVALADSMMYVYEPYEPILAVAFLGTIIYLQLGKRNECNINGLKGNIGYVIILAVTTLVSYALMVYFVGIALYGWPLHRFQASLLHVNRPWHFKLTVGA